MSKTISSSIKKSLELIKNTNFDEALDLLRQSLRKNPRDIQALNVIGQLYIELKNYPEAINNFERSLKIDPNDFEIISRLAYAYEKDKQFTKAVERYTQSLKINPRQHHLYDCLGRTLAKDNRDFEALAYLFKAIEKMPENHEVHNNIAFTSKKLGIYDMAFKHYEAALNLQPQSLMYMSCLVFNAHKDPSQGLKEFKDLAKNIYDNFTSKIEGSLGIDIYSRLDPNKTKLRVGFVSADLMRHPVSAYLEEILEKIDRSSFELYFYSANEHQDEVTERIKKLADKFELISRKSDLEAAQLIANDHIDVLFDLSGYTKGARLGIFKIKAAPVQVTHIGYFGTLAMPEIDFFIADTNLIREGEERFFTETIYNIPDCYCHCALHEIPEHSKALAFDRNGYITFGSMNGLHKISPYVMSVWAKILREVPNSKLLMDNQVISSEENRNYVTNIFQRNGISKDRLILKASSPRAEFLQSYNQIDIALDPFPYGGGTTTIESLMMGVPVVTINGDRWVSRQSTGFLKTAGHPELITANEDEYINKTIELANDAKRLREYKYNLREDTINSELNINKYLPKFEKAIKDMWQIQCEKMSAKVFSNSTAVK